MIVLKKLKLDIENSNYSLELSVQELHSESEGSYPQFYVSLFRDYYEITFFEPNDLGLALDYYKELEEYITEKSRLYNEMESRLTTIYKNS